MLERESQRNVEVMWLIGKLTPEHKTISDFRKNNPLAIRLVCREFTLLCRKLELFGADLVAIDGSKFRAVNNRSRNFTQQKLEKLMTEADERIDAYLKELDYSDAEEPEVKRLTAEQMREKIQKLKERKQKYQGYAQQLEESGHTQLSLTDKDARLMKDKAVMEVCYNVQTAVDAKHKLIIEHQVTNDVTDKNQLSKMAMKAKQMLGAEELDVVADMGYFDGAEVKKCQAEKITTYIAQPYTSANQKQGL
jgi:hypothetical protein